MAEYIEREALLNRLKTKVKRITPIEESRDMFYHDSGVNAALTIAMLEVGKAPAADVQTVVHGEWMDCENYNDIEECSVCGVIYRYPSFYRYNYCPNCGARMDGE